jgi:hypothetical protein
MKMTLHQHFLISPLLQLGDFRVELIDLLNLNLHLGNLLGIPDLFTWHTRVTTLVFNFDQLLHFCT